MNIYQRINAVMKDVQYVQRDARVTGGGQNYSAVTHDQVVSAVRASMVKNGIVIDPNQVKGEFLVLRDVNATPQPIKMGLYSGWYDISLVNIDDPTDRTTSRVEAHAMDNGDKAPGKALTYAVKQFVVKRFYFETGENDESRAEQADIDTIDNEQQMELYGLLCDDQGNYNQKGLKLQAAFKFVNLAEIKSRKFNDILELAKK